MRTNGVLGLCIAVMIAVSGCTSYQERPNGTFDVPRQIEARSWGNDQSAMFIDNCTKKVNQVSWSNWFAFSEFPIKHCNAITKYKFAASPGKPATILAATIMGASIGTGLALSGSTVNSTATGGSASAASASASHTIVRGHR